MAALLVRRLRAQGDRPGRAVTYVLRSQLHRGGMVGIAYVHHIATDFQAIWLIAASTSWCYVVRVLGPILRRGVVN